MSDTPLGDRVRPDVEAAPWVINEIKELEKMIVALKARVEELEANTCPWCKLPGEQP